MARTFRRPRQSHPIAELNVTNLVDLGFTLLIIFMIATTFSKSEQTIPVNLPAQSKTLQAKPDPNQKFMVIGVDQRGNFYIDSSPTPLTREQLHRRVEEAAALPNQPVVRVRADKTVAYEKVIQIMDELTKSGLTKISFDTQEQQ